METLTDIHRDETARRERARQYENALGALANAKSRIARLTPLVEQYANQIRILTKIDALLPDLDPKIDTGTGLLRERVIKLVALGMDDQQRRHTEYSAELTQMRAALPGLEAAIAAFK